MGLTPPMMDDIIPLDKEKSHNLKFAMFVYKNKQI